MKSTRHRYGPPRRGDAGFTLLEILVAISVLGVLVVLLTQSVQFGLWAMRLQTEFRDRHGDLEVIDRALRRMVALADPGIYPEPPTLRGAAHRLSFTTELPLDGAGPGQRADVAIVAETGRLLLRWTPRLHVEAFGTAPAWQETVILDGVERVEFAYRGVGGPGAWSATWSADRLPALVRINILFSGRSGRRWPPIVVAPLREAAEQ